MAQGTRTLRKGELLAILGELYRDKETGTLVLQREEMNRFLYIQEGQIIFAASNAAEDKFTQILVDEGRLSHEQLEMAMEKKENRTIGRTLVEMGFLGSSDLLDALVAQLRKIAFSAMAWDSGMAVFKTGALPQNVARLPISTPRFLVDLALSIEDRESVSSSLGQLDAPIQISPAEREVMRDLPPTPQEARLLEQIDGQRNVRQICERAGVDLFTGARFLLGLSHLGQVHVRQIIAPAAASKTAPEPMDLSFLDDRPPEGKAAPKVSPTAPPKAAGEKEQASPGPGGLPFDSGKGKEPADGFLLEECSPADMPPLSPSGSLSGNRQARPVDTPALLPPPDREPAPAASGPPPPRFLLEERKPSRVKQVFVIAFAALILIGAGAASLWYFFLRDSEVIPVPPVQATQHVQKTTPPAVVQPSVEGTSATPGPETPQAAPSSTPGMAQPTETGSKAPSASSTPVASPAPATPVAPAPENPEPSPATAAPTQASQSEAQQGWDLLSAGRYPEAAKAFRVAFTGRSGGYAINIEVACQDDTIAKGWAAASSDKDFCVFPYSLKGRPCYLVLWGYYPDKPSAEAAMRGLPVFFLQSAQPRVITWSKVMELTGTSP